MAIAGNPLGWITGMVHQDFLGHEENPAGRCEPLNVKAAVGPAKLHQIDARQIAGCVVEKHVFAARIRGVDPPGIGAGMPAIDRGVVLHAGIAALPGALRHPFKHIPGLETWAGLGRIRDPAGGPRVVAIDRFHELVREPNRKIGILKQNRTIGLTIEI